MIKYRITELTWNVALRFPIEKLEIIETTIKI